VVALRGGGEHGVGREGEALPGHELEASLDPGWRSTGHTHTDTYIHTHTDEYIHIYTGLLGYVVQTN
jgi:hypothetical protein